MLQKAQEIIQPWEAYQGNNLSFCKPDDDGLFKISEELGFSNLCNKRLENLPQSTVRSIGTSGGQTEKCSGELFSQNEYPSIVNQGLPRTDCDNIFGFEDDFLFPSPRSGFQEEPSFNFQLAPIQAPSNFGLFTLDDQVHVQQKSPSFGYFKSSAHTTLIQSAPNPFLMNTQPVHTKFLDHKQSDPPQLSFDIQTLPQKSSHATPSSLSVAKPIDLSRVVTPTKSQSEEQINPILKKYQDYEKASIVVNNLNDPLVQRDLNEKKNQENFKRFLQAKKIAENKKLDLSGLLYDKAKGQFVRPQEVSDPALRNRVMDPKFMVKNGGLFQKMEAEIQIFRQGCQKEGTSQKQGDLSRNMNLIALDSVKKNDSQFFQPGKFIIDSSSPMRLLPRKPQAKSVNSHEAPDLEMIGASGCRENIERQKLPLLQPFQIYHQNFNIDQDNRDEVILCEKDPSIIPIDCFKKTGTLCRPLYRNECGPVIDHRRVIVTDPKKFAHLASQSSNQDQDEDEHEDDDLFSELQKSKRHARERRQREILEREILKPHNHEEIKQELADINILPMIVPTPLPTKPISSLQSIPAQPQIASPSKILSSTLSTQEVDKRKQSGKQLFKVIQDKQNSVDTQKSHIPTRYNLRDRCSSQIVEANLLNEEISRNRKSSESDDASCNFEIDIPCDDDFEHKGPEDQNKLSEKLQSSVNYVEVDLNVTLKDKLMSSVQQVQEHSLIPDQTSSNNVIDKNLSLPDQSQRQLVDQIMYHEKVSSDEFFQEIQSSKNEVQDVQILNDASHQIIELESSENTVINNPLDSQQIIIISDSSDSNLGNQSMKEMSVEEIKEEDFGKLTFFQRSLRHKQRLFETSFNNQQHAEVNIQSVSSTPLQQQHIEENKSPCKSSSSSLIVLDKLIAAKERLPQHKSSFIKSNIEDVKEFVKTAQTEQPKINPLLEATLRERIVFTPLKINPTESQAAKMDEVIVNTAQTLFRVEKVLSPSKIHSPEKDSRLYDVDKSLEEHSIAKSNAQIEQDFHIPSQNPESNEDRYKTLEKALFKEFAMKTKEVRLQEPSLGFTRVTKEIRKHLENFSKQSKHSGEKQRFKVLLDYNFRYEIFAIFNYKNWSFKVIVIDKYVENEQNFISELSSRDCVVQPSKINSRPKLLTESKVDSMIPAKRQLLDFDSREEQKSGRIFQRQKLIEDVQEMISQHTISEDDSQPNSFTKMQPLSFVTINSSQHNAQVRPKSNSQLPKLLE